MPQKKEQTFESALKELEEIVAGLESNELTLNDALERFEKGVKLMRICEQHLQNAEGKIKELLKGKDGAFVEKILGSTVDSFVDGENSDE
jgi:exodeoxyribonuclease VII small subunit